VIRCKSSCTSLKQSLLFSLTCTIHLSVSLSVRGLAACCIACHHFAICLHPTPHTVSDPPVKPSLFVIASLFTVLGDFPSLIGHAPGRIYISKAHARYSSLTVSPPIFPNPPNYHSSKGSRRPSSSSFPLYPLPLISIRLFDGAFS